jgi:hypothetical protein
MGASDLIAVSVSLSGSASPTRQGFGTPCFAAYFNPATHWQNTGDRIRFYPASSALVELAADGFNPVHPIYRAFEVALAQENAPLMIALARRALPFTQILKMTCTSTTAGDPYVFSVVGSDDVATTYRFTSTGVPATDAASIAGLMTAAAPTGSAASLVYAAGVVTLTGGTGFTASMVGQPLDITAATNPANKGAFVIASYVSATSVTYANPLGVTDAGAAVAWYVGHAVGTVTASLAVITITQVAGVLTDLQAWCPFLQIANTTSDPGIATDLAAIQAANSIGWYGLALDSNSASEVESAAAFIEATGQGGKVAFFDSADTANVTAVTTDLNSALQARSYVKSHVGQSNKAVLSCAGFAMASLILAMNPGSYDLSYKTLAGVVVDDDQSMPETEQLTLNTASTSQPGTGGKNGNWYKSINGLNLTFPGVTPGGRWMDTTIFIDWLQANMQADLLAYRAGLPKLPLTNMGIEGAKSVMKSRLKIGGSPPFGGLDLTQPYGVSGPTIETMSPADINNRNLAGLSAFGFLSGSINTIGVQVTVTP